MELENIKPKNLKEAKKKYDEECMNAEIACAKDALTIANDNINRIDRRIKELEEEKKPYLETIAKFNKKGE